MSGKKSPSRGVAGALEGVGQMIEGALGMAGGPPTILQRRVAMRLADLHMSARKASLGAGLGPDAVRTILTGRSKSPRAENLQALARELECDIGYLMGTQDEPFADHTPRRLEDETFVGVVPMYVHERLRIGWTDLSRDAEEKWRETSIPTLPQYLPGAQYLALLDDTSFNRFFPRGSILHVLLARTDESTVRDGDIVIVHRQRLQDEAGQDNGAIEKSVRLVRQIAPGNVVLETASTDPAVQDVVIYEGKTVDVRAGNFRLDRKKRESVAIWGFVLRAYIHASGPPIMGREVSEEDLPERTP